MRTPIIQRSKGACTVAVVALGCAIFGVGGAAAGDSTYHRHLREHARQQRLAGLALANRTPEQFVLAMKSKAPHHRAYHRHHVSPAPAPAAAPTPAAASAPAAGTPAATPHATAASQATTTSTPSQPATTPATAAATPASTVAIVTPTAPATTNAATGMGTITPDTGSGTTTTDPTATSTTDTGTDTTTTDPTATGTADPAATTTTDAIGTDTTTTDTTGTDTTTTDTTGTDTTTTDATGTDTTTTDATGTDTSTTDTTDTTAATPAQAVGTATLGATCHGRCTSGSDGGVLPAALPSTTSSSGSFNITANPVAPVASTPAGTVTVDNSAGAINPIVAPPSTPAASTPTIPLNKVPTFISTRALKRVTHGKGARRAAGVTPLVTAGSSAVITGTGGTGAGATAPAAGTIVAAAPAAGTTAAATAPTGTHHAAKKRTSTGSTLPAPLSSSVQVIDHVVKFVPTAVWFALGALAALALAFAALALRSSRRARRREKEFAAISAAAQTDALTGILNRRGFMSAAERELARASRYERPFVLAYVDVRGLKAVNDSEGHLMGDELIKTVAGLMKESARADDVVGRIGGDEFALLLGEQTAEGAEPVLRRIRARVNERRAAMEIHVPWELTIGIAAFPEDGTTLEELLGVSDRRLYEQRGIALR